MEESVKPREVILKNIRDALVKPSVRRPAVPDRSSEIYITPTEKDPVVLFAENFLNTKGRFLFCENENEFLTKFSAFVRKGKPQHTKVLEKPLVDLISRSGITFDNSDTDFEQCDLGVTSCECLIARTGSILITSASAAGRRLSIVPTVHVVIAYTSRVVYDISDAFKLAEGKYPSGLPSCISLTTGPSRTADIEKTLVTGAHGPKELVLFLINDQDETTA